MSDVACRACGALIDEGLDFPGTCAPCPQCGSTARAFDVHQTERAAAGDYRKRKVKRRRAGKGKPYMVEIDGDDLFRNTGEWMHLERTIDRANDRYSERIVAPRTGEVVHQCEEPLKAHRGHGSDKKR